MRRRSASPVLRDMGGRLRSEEAAGSAALLLEYDWQREGGFDRSRMPDRDLPRRLDAHISWPADLTITQLVPFGDARHWRKHYRVTTITAADSSLARIADGDENVGDWTRDGKDGSPARDRRGTPRDDADRARRQRRTGTDHRSSGGRADRDNWRRRTSDEEHPS